MSDNTQSQEDAIRELEEKRRQAFLDRMKQTQAIRDEIAKTNPVAVGLPPDGIERCSHGIPLGRSCRICDVIRPEDIKDSIPLQ